MLCGLPGWLSSVVWVARLAEQYRNSQSSKEKILKAIEVKKEHLNSLQPGLNAIMQVHTHTHTPESVCLQVHTLSLPTGSHALSVVCRYLIYVV